MARDLPAEWRTFADQLEEEAAALRREGFPGEAEENELAAIEYRAAAEESELGLHRDDHSASRRADVLELEAPHLLAPARPIEAAGHDA